MARARAISTRRASPVGRESVGSSATWQIPTRAELVVRLLGRRPPARRACAAAPRPPSGRSPGPTACRTAPGAGTSAPGPRRARTCGLAPVTSWTPRRHASRAVGSLQAGDHVEQRGLAGTVGADQAVDLAGGHVERRRRRGPGARRSAPRRRSTARAGAPGWRARVSQRRTPRAESPPGTAASADPALPAPRPGPAGLPARVPPLAQTRVDQTEPVGIAAHRDDAHPEQDVGESGERRDVRGDERQEGHADARPAPRRSAR